MNEKQWYPIRSDVSSRVWQELDYGMDICKGTHIGLR